MEKKNRLINIFYSIICAFLFPLFISDTTHTFSNSIISIVLVVLIFLLLQKTYKINYDRKTRILSHILGFIFSMITALGYGYERYHYSPIGKIIIPIIVFSHIYASLIILMWDKLGEFEEVLSASIGSSKIYKVATWILERPLIIVLILLVMWLPCYLADFPGGYRYDAAAEFRQIENGYYEADFPLLHAVIVTRFYPFIYDIFGSYNYAVAIYVVVQMILVALLYTHVFRNFFKKGINRVLLLLVLIYTGVFPVIQILVVQSGRDVMFASLLTLLAFKIYEIAYDRDSFYEKWSRPFFFGLLVVLTVFSRNNNAGAVFLIILIAFSLAIWLLNFKKHLRGVTVLISTIIVSYIVLGHVLTALCQPLWPPQVRTTKSIMAQQLGRAYIIEAGGWSQAEVDEFESFFDMEEWATWGGYKEDTCDPTKVALLVDENNSKEFDAYWLKMFKKNPHIFLDAYLMCSMDMWFPASIVSADNSLEDGEKGYFRISPSTEEWPIEHITVVPVLERYYEAIGSKVSFEKIPIISMLFSIGFWFCVLMFSVFYTINKGRKKVLLPMMVMLIYMLLASFVPVIILRYFAAIFMFSPILIVLVLQQKSLE